MIRRVGRPSPRAATDEPWHPPATRDWQDSPSRSAASVAAQALLDLGYLTGRGEYAVAARKALAAFAGGADRRWGTFLAGYAAALDRLLHGPRTILVVGPAADAGTRALADSARRAYVPGGMVLALDPSVAHQAALLHRLGYEPADDRKPVAYVCRARVCLAPAETPQQLAERIAEVAKAE